MRRDRSRAGSAAAATKFLEEPTVTVVVRQINSRRVYITGEVAKPGPYNLSGPMTVLQLIATAGGVLEYADAKNIVVMRTENGKPVSYPFNYKDVIKRKNLKQNIELKPGDTVIVP
ncbi:MAG: SLBB domain-containing protein [Acidobacteria bacterium]|nr:SLBB domain-containing protein [Acidobacteriota bacterium]